MARTQAQIQSLMTTTFQAQPELLAANSTSKRSIWQLILFVVSTQINIFEQILDSFRASVQLLVSQSAPGTPQWLQNQVLNFQFSATAPQIIQLIGLVPTYPTVNTSLRIISRVSVKTTLANTVQIKVAKNNPPIALAAPEISALQGYINTIGFVGINYSVSSANADQLYVQALVYYQGAYSAIILANITTSINNFLAALPFDGSMRLSDLEGAIRTTTGVNDVILQNVIARRDQDTIANGTYLIQNQTEILRNWNTVSGYIIPENTVGSTLANTITLIPQ